MGSSLRKAPGIVVGGSECPALSPPSIAQLRCCPLLRVCVCVCVCVCSLLTAVCVHLDGLNAEHKFRVWVTIPPHITSFRFLILYAICAAAVCLKYSQHHIAVSIRSSKFLYLLVAATEIINNFSNSQQQRSRSKTKNI